MRRLRMRLGLPLIGTAVIALLTFAPAFTQAAFAWGSNPCDGYMYGSPCMGYQMPYSHHYSQPPAHSQYSYHYYPPHTAYDYDDHSHSYYSMTTVYVVHSGDTLAIIARRYGVSVTAMQHANPYISDPDHIIVGQVLVIPSGHVYSYGGYSSSGSHMSGYGYSSSGW